MNTEKKVTKRKQKDNIFQEITNLDILLSNVFLYENPGADLKVDFVAVTTRGFLSCLLLLSSM